MPHNILLITDNPSVAANIREALVAAGDEAFQLVWARSCVDGLERLRHERAEGPQEHAIAAVLVDLELPDSQGIETLDQLVAAACHIPLLVLSGPRDEELAKLAVQRGAQDYLLKARVDTYLLPKALRHMIERAVIAEALFDEKELAQVTLNCIGDAVLTTNMRGEVTYLNVVAEKMTGWMRDAAAGRPFEEVCRLIDGTARTNIGNPMQVAVRENRPVALPPNCILVRRDDTEVAIEDSIAPIHDRRGRSRGAVMIFRDASAGRSVTLRMAYLAQHDSLTDLPNRVLFSDRLTQAIAMAHRHHHKLAVLYLDVDRFKHFNDSVGHDVGDRLLQSVARRLLACVRSSDTVSRQGGDEFVILLSEVAQAEDVAIVAEKILVALRDPHGIDDHDLHLTASIGIATYPEGGLDSDTLMKNADFAMYHAKSSGRNCYEFFEPQMNLRASERQSLEHDLRHAIERHELQLHYQPKIMLSSAAVIGAEALIRWHHPRRGMVPPAEFIPIAEECGFIVPIGRWVLREACKQAHAWTRSGLPSLRIAVNVSAVELRAKEFVGGVRAILDETGYDPRHVEFELTETFLLQDSTSTSSVLKSLTDMGVGIALDDFGTGYSSLTYLKKFPIDTLKIDKSFVHDITTDADDASIVSAVISMGRSLHMEVVAEGVESVEQLEFLLNRGCPEGQGYYFSRPLAGPEFAALWRRSISSSAEAVSVGA